MAAARSPQGAGREGAPGPAAAHGARGLRSARLSGAAAPAPSPAPLPGAAAPPASPVPPVPPFQALRLTQGRRSAPPHAPTCRAAREGGRHRGTGGTLRRAGGREGGAAGPAHPRHGHLPHQPAALPSPAGAARALWRRPQARLGSCASRCRFHCRRQHATANSNWRGFYYFFLMVSDLLVKSVFHETPCKSRSSPDWHIASSSHYLTGATAHILPC